MKKALCDCNYTINFDSPNNCKNQETLNVGSDQLPE